MTLRGIHNTAHGLSYYSRLQEVTANNLANVSTGGFKLHRLAGELAADGTYPVPVETLDLRQGPLRHTGRELDLALEGPGFFVVQTPAGERFARGGNFRLDQSGTLVDADGHAVLGARGAIRIPSGQVDVQQDGTVLVDGAVLDRLRLETVADPQQLRKEGNGRFVGGPGIPVDSATRVQQRMSEDSNGDSVLGMIDLVTIQRAYTANVDALKAMDSVLGAIAGEVGKA